MRCYAALWVLPVTAPPIRDGAVLVDDEGRIAAVGTRASMPHSARFFELHDAILLPGLVNAHAHPELSAFRGILEDLPFHQWIPSLMRCKRGAALTFDDYVTAARWTCIEALRAGVTTMGATEDSGAAVIALREAKMRGTVYLEVFGPAPEQAEASLTTLTDKVEHFRALASDRIMIGVSPHAPYTVSDPLYRAVAQYARGEDLPVAVHAAEAEAEELLLREGLGPFAAGLRSRGIATPVRAPTTIQLLKQNGILACQPMLIHAVRMTRDDITLAADAGATVAHCPIANARLGHGIAPIVEMRAAGINVAVGTDSVASNNRMDVLEEARVAQLLQRSRLQSAGALASDELLRMATIDGARALGIADRTGSLEVGKDADLCVVSLEQPHNVPAPDPVAALFHSARGTDVIMTAVRGEILYVGGRVLGFDVEQLRRDVERIGARLFQALESSA
ncbi:MAG TPA: amidohydrolase family protein [Longimicrobiales bacterium]